MMITVPATRALARKSDDVNAPVELTDDEKARIAAMREAIAQQIAAIDRIRASLDAHAGIMQSERAEDAGTMAAQMADTVDNLADTAETLRAIVAAEINR